MAAGRKETAQIAIIPNTKCEICEDNDIRWKCFNCEEYLCDQCKKHHLKGKATRNHKITSIAGSDQHEREYDTQRDSNCSIHESETFLMFCMQCDVPVCTECIASESHSNHKLVKIEDIIDRELVDLSKITEVTTERLSGFEEMVTLLDKNELEYASDIFKTVDKVKTRNMQIKQELDQITDDIISTLTKKEEENREQTKKRRDEIQNRILELKKVVNECRNQQTHKDVAMVQFVTRNKHCMDQYNPPELQDLPNPPAFVTGKVDVQQLKDLFGELDPESDDRSVHKATEQLPLIPTINIQIMQTFQIAHESIVATVDNDKAWLGNWSSAGISLVTTDGKDIKFINTAFGLDDMVTTKSGELLLTVSNKVKKLLPDDTFKDIYTAEQGFGTRGITVTDDDNVVVCLYNSNKKTGKIVILSSNGCLLNTLEKDGNGKDVLYESPWRVDSNRNGDLIVIQDKEVTAVNKSGDKVFTYTGQGGSLKKPFDPSYIVTDKYGQILISDNNNSVIHSLDKDGNFLRFLLTEEHGLNYPRGMSIDNSNKLWVCSWMDQKIMVVKYL